MTDPLAFLDWRSLGAAAPWLLAVVFLAASALMIWRLEILSGKGFEGTVLGTLIMPYCSGVGNLVFAWVMGRSQDASGEVFENCLVNNVTNLTLLLGLPTVIWGAVLFGKKKKLAKKAARDAEINRLSLLLTLLAGLFFTGIVWALARDGRLDFGDGVVLVAVFLFWQCFHVFEVLKSNVRQNQSLPWSIYPELAILVVGAIAVYWSINALVEWIGAGEGTWINREHLGWLSAWLMVLPNALLAMFYGWRGRAEVVYASQVGDGHICIPLCLGIYAMLTPAAVPPIFLLSIRVLVLALAAHVVLVALFGRPPRLVGWLFLAGYGIYLWKGLPAG
ncbi:MAG TPA: sodium:calcium symporter [Verrucomicrobiales bacterium]|nr:sodium:calcium symporter [Verrucomicrobiales bacterium]